MALVFFLVAMAGWLDVAGRIDGGQHLTVIALQVVLILLTSVIYCKIKGEDFTKRLKLRAVGLEQILLAFLGAVILVCGSLIIGIATGTGTASEEFSLYNTYNVRHDGTAESFFIITIAYAALPAVCEEFMFRGVISAEYEKYGIPLSIVMTTLFFSMLHFSLPMLIIYVFAGIVIHLTTLATRSLLGGIVLHFLFNMYGLFGQSAINEIYKTTGSDELFILILVAVLLVFLFLFCSEAARLYRRYSRANLPSSSPSDRTREVSGRGRRKKADDLREKQQRKQSDIYYKALLTPPSLACYLIFLVAALTLGR